MRIMNTIVEMRSIIKTLPWRFFNRNCFYSNPKYIIFDTLPPLIRAQNIKATLERLLFGYSALSHLWWYKTVMRTFHEAKLLALLTLGYGLFYFANNLSTDFLYLTPGAHLVHLPSGIKILMTLVAGPIGALAIFIVSSIWGLLFPFPGQLGLVFFLSVGSAGVPLLVCKICSDKFRLDGELSNLTLKSLLAISFSYAVLNSLVTQSILFIADDSLNLWGGIGVMFLGDLTGILLVVAISRWISGALKTKLSK